MTIAMIAIKLKNWQLPSAIRSSLLSFNLSRNENNWIAKHCELIKKVQQTIKFKFHTRNSFLQNTDKIYEWTVNVKTAAL